MKYTHWLVTKGKDQFSVKKHGLVPILLAPMDVPIRTLPALVKTEVDRRACLFLDEKTSAVDVMRASTRPYVLDMMQDLWLSEVRLEIAIQFYAGDEEVIYWTLVGSGQLPPAWQGPADGIIPSDTPVTIRGSEPTPFKILDE